MMHDALNYVTWNYLKSNCSTTSNIGQINDNIASQVFNILGALHKVHL